MEEINLKNMTVEQFQEMKAKMDAAENDTTPFAIVEDDDQLSVVGDVEKTQKVTHDYVIGFGYPNTKEWKKAITEEGLTIQGETPSYLFVKREYKDVWVPPRTFTNVQTAFIELYNFFNIVMEDGSLRDLNEEEIKEALRMLDQDLMDAMCHVVAMILGIPQREEVYMMELPTMVATVKIINDFPEIVNSSDFFSSKSSEGI